MYTYQTKVRMQDTDAANRIYFANMLHLAHNAYEEFLESIGYPMSSILEKKEFFLPIVHTEADYKKQLFVGDELTIKVVLDHIGSTSFGLAYGFFNNDNEEVGTAKTVHVTVNARSGIKIPIPEEFRLKMETVLNK